ncbi:MAG: PorV/PorQ family protein [Odoribacter sp.]|nr:PorV/PorQ family protein [Odoribacter sp.]
MKKIYITSIFLYLISFAVFAQVETNSDSEAASFLGITPDARSAGMGGVGTALNPDAFSLYHNAASTLFSKEKGAIAFSYAPWMRDLVSGSTLISIGSFYKINNKQSVVVGFRNFSHPDMNFKDENGNIIEKFTPNEWTFDLGYSRLLTKNLSMALTLHYIHSDMGSYNGSDAASAVAFDFSVFYQRKTSLMDSATWSVGLQVANIGSKIKYLDTKYDLPGKVSVGGQLNLPFSKNHILNCALDLGYQMIPSGSANFYAGVGAEYTCMKYAVLRAGYHLGDKDKGYNSYGSVGCGVRYYHISGDFSYLLAGSDNPLKNSYQLSIGIDFNLFCSKK